MSTSKLRKYLDHPIKSRRVEQRVILLSDSKGRYLAPYAESGWDVDIVSKSGCTIPEGFYWLNRNIDRLLQRHGSFTLCVWLGTCDLTQKVGKTLSLRHNTVENCLKQVTNQIGRFYQLLANYPRVNIVFLEIPPYSLVQWFRSKGLVSVTDLLVQDLQLAERIDLVNEFIRQENYRRSVWSPKFKLDLVNYRKTAGGSSRKGICFRNYLDGVHPDPLLSKVWLKRIVEQLSY